MFFLLGDIVAWYLCSLWMEFVTGKSLYVFGVRSVKKVS